MMHKNKQKYIMKRKHEVNPIMFQENKNYNNTIKPALQFIITNTLRHNYLHIYKIKQRLQSGFKKFKRFSFNYMQR